MEGPQPEVDQEAALDQLIRAELFEQVLQQRYLGTKRFSLEGVTALIPLVDEILEAGRAAGDSRIGDGDEPSRAAKRDCPQSRRRAPEEVFARFRGCRSAQRARRRRREVPHGRDRRVCDA